VYDYDPGNITGVMIYGIMFRTIPLKMTRVKKKKLTLFEDGKNVCNCSPLCDTIDGL